jgi:hypothetical protein
MLKEHLCVPVSMKHHGFRVKLGDIRAIASELLKGSDQSCTTSFGTGKSGAAIAMELDDNARQENRRSDHGERKHYSSFHIHRPTLRIRLLGGRASRGSRGSFCMRLLGILILLSLAMCHQWTSLA